jgi:uncharacterized protein YjbJ (UPF0337 family)
MDWNRIEGNWKQTAGKIKEKWGKLTDDDLTQISGKREQFEGKIQERYGLAKDKVRSDVDTWLNSLDRLVSLDALVGAFPLARFVRPSLSGVSLSGGIPLSCLNIRLKPQLRHEHGNDLNLNRRGSVAYSPSGNLFRLGAPTTRFIATLATHIPGSVKN